MPDVKPDFILDEIPGAESIRMFRDRARESDQSICVAYQSVKGQERMLVISNRGTCVIVGDEVTIDTYNRDTDPDEVAEALTLADG